MNELELILNEPGFFLDEYFGKIRNQIDIQAEQAKQENPTSDQVERVINKERAELPARVACRAK